MNVFYRKLNSLYFKYKIWRIRFGVRILNNKGSEIDNVVFLIGVGGGGLTLLHRILSRHPQVVYVTGNYKYWAGADEMQRVLAGEFPFELSFRGGYYYADNENLVANEEISDKDRDRFINILKKVICLNKPKGIDKELYFVDKSQSYTLRVGLLNKIFHGSNPKFVLIVRNPYVWCWRAVKRAGHDSMENQKEEVRKAAEHWNSSFERALFYKNKADMIVYRFEDLLQDPYNIVKNICDFIGLEFRKEILPGKDDKIPFGSAIDAYNKQKWHPLRPDVNEKYLKDMPRWAVDIVDRECGVLAKRFNYSNERGK